MIGGKQKRKCSFEGCDKVHHARGWCTTHWTRVVRHGAPHIKLKVGRRKSQPTHCVALGCLRPTHAKSRCLAHYRRKHEKDSGEVRQTIK